MKSVELLEVENMLLTIRCEELKAQNKELKNIIISLFNRFQPMKLRLFIVENDKLFVPHYFNGEYSSIADVKAALVENAHNTTEAVILPIMTVDEIENLEDFLKSQFTAVQPLTETEVVELVANFKNDVSVPQTDPTPSVNEVVETATKAKGKKKV